MIRITNQKNQQKMWSENSEDILIQCVRSVVAVVDEQKQKANSQNIDLLNYNNHLILSRVNKKNTNLISEISRSDGGTFWACVFLYLSSSMPPC